ncbi:DUF55-domain-containing protein [Gonapodya prolifera JEL478]|uniref:DUF55-domain-containing protein n=1 Tax=Gonapodya prolifera (strain JEL478) TaxID=1344416 RepID=A0A139A5Y1_GONPJ|nr:DUF55-domain-containing protein [Gonapodya prolifera JEL478]|eukprot:KXS12196.1 DUF55-domain-containing protein [Gonapodya prolifera JEL478]
MPPKKRGNAAPNDAKTDETQQNTDQVAGSKKRRARVDADGTESDGDHKQKSPKANKKAKSEDPERKPGEKMYWLMKAECDTRVVNGKDVKFDIDDFEAMGASPWDGVRNFVARNIMRDRMKLGDLVFFYHSNCSVPGIAGVCEVVKEGYPDESAFDKNHPYYDPKSDRKNPKWFRVDVKLLHRLPRFVPLAELKLYATPESPVQPPPLAEMMLVNRGRLSVQPVRATEWEFITALAEKDLTDGVVLKGKGKGSKKAKEESSGKEEDEADEQTVDEVVDKKKAVKRPRGSKERTGGT